MDYIAYDLKLSHLFPLQFLSPNIRLIFYCPIVAHEAVWVGHSSPTQWATGTEKERGAELGSVQHVVMVSIRSSCSHRWHQAELPMRCLPLSLLINISNPTVLGSWEFRSVPSPHHQLSLVFLFSFSFTYSFPLLFK